MKQDLYVVGVGMVPFTKLGASEPDPQMAAKAGRAALRDAGLEGMRARLLPDTAATALVRPA